MKKVNFSFEKTAKILSLTSLGIISIFVVGNFFSPQQQLPNLSEFLQMLLFPVGLIVGFLISWKYELLGFIISTSSMITFYLAEYLLKGVIMAGITFILLYSPAILFLISYILKQRKNKRPV